MSHWLISSSIALRAATMVGTFIPFRLDALSRRLVATCRDAAASLGSIFSSDCMSDRVRRKMGAVRMPNRSSNGSAPREPGYVENAEAQKYEGRNDRPSVTHDPSPCSMNRNLGPTRLVAQRGQEERAIDILRHGRNARVCLYAPPAKAGRSIERLPGTKPRLVATRPARPMAWVSSSHVVCDAS